MNNIKQSPGVLVVPSDNQISECRIMVGTSGYSYLEWVDSGFYPAGTKSAEMLAAFTKMGLP